MIKLVLVGAGGHSDSVKCCIDRSVYEVIGYLDDVVTGEYRGLPIFGRNPHDVPFAYLCKFFLCIGDNEDRGRWYQRLMDCRYQTINIIDKTASVDETAKLGNGNFIGKKVIIDAETILGNDNVINTGAVIEHGSIIGDHTNISTTAVLNGDVIVADYAMVGSGAIVNGQLRIGEHSTVGSGAVVTRNVNPNAIVIGIPAKELSR